MSKSVRQVLASFLLTMIVLAFFNSGSLLTWTYDLKPESLSDALSGVVEAWDAAMERLGTAGITQSLREWFQDSAGLS